MLLCMQNLPFPGRRESCESFGGMEIGTMRLFATSRGVRTIYAAYRTLLSHMARAILGVIQRTRACFVLPG